MIIHDVEQRSVEWKHVRGGVVTASNAGAMHAKGKRAGEEAVGRRDLKHRLAVESLRGVPLEEDSYENHWMRRGRELEAEGIGAYEAATGELVQSVGFIQHDTLPAGCSPDGIVGNYDGGLELKCPKFTTHLQYVLRGTLPSEYAPQVIHSLFVTGLPWWDFCSYCPELEGVVPVLFRVRVHRADVDLAAYELAFRLFWGEVEQVKQTLRELSVAPELVHA